MTRRENDVPRAARSAGHATLALAGVLLAGCSVDVDADGDVIDPAASQLYATWYTIDERGVAIDCHAVADVVRISSYNRHTGEVFVDVFDCGLEAGTTDFIPVGSYDVDVDLVRCGGQPCDTSPRVVDGFTVPVLVDRDDAVFDLGDFELVAPPGPSV